MDDMLMVGCIVSADKIVPTVGIVFRTG